MITTWNNPLAPSSPFHGHVLVTTAPTAPLSTLSPFVTSIITIGEYLRLRQSEIESSTDNFRQFCQQRLYWQYCHYFLCRRIFITIPGDDFKYSVFINAIKIVTTNASP
jgi:hypothetical protein